MGGFSFGKTARNSRRKPGKHREVEIGNLRHRIKLCTASDVIIDGATIVIQRTEAMEVWAEIKEKAGSLWSPQGAPVRDNRERRTHCIYVRRREDFEISSAAWIYESRLRLPARWFKVLEVKELDETGIYPWFWALDCRLVQKSDFAAPPQSPDAKAAPIVPMRPGVKL